MGSYKAKNRYNSVRELIYLIIIYILLTLLIIILAYNVYSNIIGNTSIASIVNYLTKLLKVI